jgi:hypothetical protein
LPKIIALRRIRAADYLNAANESSLELPTPSLGKKTASKQMDGGAMLKAIGK